MRKKEIVEQNSILFKKLGEAKSEIDELKAELQKNNEELNALKTQIAEKEKPVSEPLKMLEKKVQRIIPNLTEDLQFASEKIGKIVLESARYSNMLTADGEVKYRELVNLILGKSEVAKAEILAVTKEKIDIEEKKARITKIKDDTIEYFDLVMAQR
ncbi:MAG: hypothetical protein MJ090_03565 [Clostridia bacterium]|nr:hypothetical protein [Clostridia bacterium]